ncbi:integrase [Streptococcus milleri]|uniref:IS3 family transposase n=1 Tax=Streptococcus milleri TaxID=33040 RepID=UPI000F71922B|nr:IS3 family transposase [Streptococcus milleri]VEE82800.1 integrase [Streptococcus milleri]
MVKKTCSVETKLACIEMKKAGKSNKVITVKVLEELSEVEQLRLLKKIHGLIVNRKKVYRIMKERGWLCRARPKKVPNIGQPYYVIENKLDRDF